MMKKLTSVCILVCLVLSLTACGRESKLTLGEYKGITYKPISTEIADAELEAALSSVVKEMTEYETDESRKDTEVKDGDILLIDYAGKLKETGEEFSGGTAKEQRLTIGSGKFIAGFEDALIGKKVGETCDITVTFPEKYSVEQTLAGKEAIFTVTIHEVQTEKVPELTDELISEYTEGAHKTVASYRTYCGEYLKQQKELQAEESRNKEVMEKILAGTTFEKINKDTVEDYYNSVLEYYVSIAEYMSIDLATYVEYYYDKSLEDFYAELRAVAEDTVKEQLVLGEIIEKENIKLSDEKYEEMLADYMEQYDYTDRAAFEKDYTVKALRQSMLYDLALDFIMEHAVAE